MLEVVQNGSAQRFWRPISDFRKVHAALSPPFNLPFGNGNGAMDLVKDKALEAKTSIAALLLCACGENQTSHAMEFDDSYQHMIQVYLDSLLNEPRLRCSPAVAEFLDLSPATKSSLALVLDQHLH